MLKDELKNDVEVQDLISDILKEKFKIDSLPNKTFYQIFGIPISEVSKADLSIFDYFLKKSGEEIAFASLFIPGQEVCSKQEAILKIKNFHKVYKDGFFHDVTHSFISYSRTQSYVPLFFTEKKRFNNLKMIEEEPQALIFGSVFGDLPIFISLLSKQGAVSWFKSYETFYRENNYRGSSDSLIQKVSYIINEYNPESFNSVQDAFFKIVYETIKSANMGDFLNEKPKATREEYIEVEKEFRFMFSEIRPQVEKDLLEVMDNLFYNYKHKKDILYQYFVALIAAS